MPVLDVFHQNFGEGDFLFVPFAFRGCVFGEVPVLGKADFVDVDFPADAAGVGAFVGKAAKLVVERRYAQQHIL